MSKEILMFWDIEIGKYNFTAIKVLPLCDVDIEKVLVSNKISFDEKKLQVLYWLIM